MGARLRRHRLERLGSFTLTTIPNTAPVATINDHSLHVNEWAQVTDWLSYSDADGNAATKYQFWDSGPARTAATSGRQATPIMRPIPAIDVAASDLANVWVRGGTSAGSETMWVRAFDGTDWSDWDRSR